MLASAWRCRMRSAVSDYTARRWRACRKTYAGGLLRHLRPRYIISGMRGSCSAGLWGWHYRSVNQLLSPFLRGCYAPAGAITSASLASYLPRFGRPTSDLSLYLGKVPFVRQLFQAGRRNTGTISFALYCSRSGGIDHVILCWRAGKYRTRRPLPVNQ